MFNPVKCGALLDLMGGVGGCQLVDVMNVAERGIWRLRNWGCGEFVMELGAYY